MAAIEEVSDEVSDGCGCPPDAHGLECAAKGPAAKQAAFESTEQGESNQGDDDGDAECGGVPLKEHVGDERDEAARDVGECDREGRAMGLVRGWLL